MKISPVFILIIFFAWFAGGIYPFFAQSWTQIPEIDSTDVISVTEHEGELWAATLSQIFKSAGGGNSWQPVNSPPAISGNLNILFSAPGSVYLGTRGDGVFRSTDSGQSWQSVNSGLSAGALDIMGFTALGDSLYAGTSNGIYLLNLQTLPSWSVYNSGLFQLGVNSISTSGNYLVASVGYYLFVRERHAPQWTVVSLDSSGVQRLVFETLPVGQHLFAGTDNGVYRGTLDGQHWERVDISAFPGRDIVALAAQGTRIFAGLSYFGQHWIWSSDDQGMSWDFRAHEFAEGWDLLVSGNRLWAGRSDGLWYFDVTAWTGMHNHVPQAASGFTLYQNYPNPFNPETVISWQLAAGSPVKLTVYNMTGQILAVLLNEKQPAGAHSVKFDASGLAGGIYLYRLETNHFVETRKMILMR